jgi:hypothetical protein
VIPGGCLSFVVAAILGLAAPDPDARLKPVQVEFDAPAGCASAQSFLDMLRLRTDKVRLAEGDEARTTLKVRLTRLRGHVLGELRMVGDHGGADTRKVQGASCDDVVQALSLTAALALDPTALLSVPGGSSATTPASSTAATAPTDTVASVTPAQTEAERSSAERSSAEPPTEKPSTEKPPAQRFAVDTSESSEPATPPENLPVPDLVLSAEAMGLELLSGSLSLGVAVAARKTLSGQDWFRPSLGLALVYVRNDVLGSPSEAQVSLLGGAGSLCPARLSASRFTVEPCAVFVAGWLSARGQQVTHPGTADLLWLSVGATVRAGLGLAHGFSVELEGGVSAALLKRRLFTTLPRNVVAETAVFSPILGAGLGYGW